MADKNVSIDINASDRTKAAFDSVKRGLGEVGSKVDAVKGVFSAFSAIAASAGLTALMNEAVAAASKAEQSSNRLDAVLRATGNTVGFTREQLDKMADSLTAATTFDDEGIRDAQSNLIKFGRLHGDTFERALRLSADYAAFTGGEMVDATQLIGKALADPVNGATALGRALGGLSDAQKESIEKFTAQGRLTEAQAVIFRKLEESIGGTAGKMNVGLYGATTSAKKAWDELLEAMGKTGAVKLTVESSLSVVANLLGAIKEQIEGINKETQRAIERAQGKLQPLSPEQGGPAPRPGTPQIPSMTVQEVKAAAEGDLARRREEEQARRDAAAKREEDLEKQRAKSREEISTATYKRFQDQMRAHLKIVEDLRKKDYDDAVAMGAGMRELFEADQQRKIDTEIASGEHMKELRAAYQEDQILKQQNSLDNLRQSLLTEDELRKFAYEEDFNLLNNTLGMKKEAQEEYYALVGRLIRKNAAAEVAIEMQKNQHLRSMQIATWQLGVGLLQSLAGESEAAAYAVIAINTGLAIRQTIQATSVAIMRALADLGPVAGPPAAAKMALLGKVQLGLIAAAGVLQASSVGKGGAVGTFAANPSTGLPESPTGSGFSEPPPSPLQQQGVAEQRPRNVVFTFIGSGRYTQEEIRDAIIPGLQEAFDAGVKVSFVNR
jgi:phage-related minor tail protein